MFSVGNGIADNAFKENLEDSSSFFVDETRDTLDATATSETPNSGLGDTLYIISQEFKNLVQENLRMLSRRILR